MKTHLAFHCLCGALALFSGSSLAGAEGLKFALEQVANIGGRTAIGDIDGDGANDIVVHTWSSRRGIDSDGSVSWYRFPEWNRTFILENDHLFGDGVVITDLDGDADIVAGTLKRTDQPRIVVFLNQGKGEQWRTQVVARSSAYKAKLGDIDGDGDIDILSARSWEDPPIQLYRNLTR